MNSDKNCDFFKKNYQVKNPTEEKRNVNEDIWCKAAPMIQQTLSILKPRLSRKMAHGIQMSEN